MSAAQRFSAALVILSFALGSLPFGVGDTSAAVPSEEQSGTEHAAGAVGRFFDAHGWKLLVAIGIDQTGAIYDRTVGYSRDPLLFENPPGFDKAIRNTFGGHPESGAALAKYGLPALKYGVPLALIGMDWGKRHEMAEDLFGVYDSYFTNRGLTNLFKNIVGRERPELEFADPNVIGQTAFDALKTAPHNHRSFPSGHSSGSFTWASYMERVIARKVGLHSTARKFSFAAFYGVAGYIAYSRIREDEHFFSDIVAGSALGAGVSRTFYRLEHPEEFGKTVTADARFRLPRVTFHPPQIVNGGAVMTISLRLGSNRP